MQGTVNVFILTGGGVLPNTLPVASKPLGIAFDAVKKRIFISEPLANQVEVFSLTTLKRIKVLK